MKHFFLILLCLVHSLFLQGAAQTAPKKSSSPFAGFLASLVSRKSNVYQVLPQEPSTESKALAPMAAAHGEGKEEATLVAGSVWAKIAYNHTYIPILNLLARYIHRGIRFSTKTKASESDPDWDLIVQALKALGTSQATINELLQQGDLFWDSKECEKALLELDDLQTKARRDLHWRKKGKAIEAYNTALAIYEERVAKLYAQWLKAAEPCRALYEKIYRENNAAAVQSYSRILAPEFLCFPVTYYLPIRQN